MHDRGTPPAGTPAGLTAEQGLIKPQRLHRTHPVTARCQQRFTLSEHRLLTVLLRRSFEVALPNAGQVADPFGVIRLANNSINEVRRRVQNDTLGHRARKHDPLYRVRRMLIAAHERLSEGADNKLRGLLTAGDPQGEVRLAWHAKETPRGLYDIDYPTTS